MNHKKEIIGGSVVVVMLLLVNLAKRMGWATTGNGGGFEPVIIMLAIAVAIVLGSTLVYKRVRAKMEANGLRIRDFFFFNTYGDGAALSLPQYAESRVATADEEEYVEEFEQPPPYHPVQNVQKTMNNALALSPDFNHPLADFLNQNVLFIGDRRSGKSNGLGRLAEQESAYLVPMVVFDTQGDYTSLAHPGFFPRGVLVGSQRMAGEYKRLPVHALDAKSAFRFGRTVVAEGLQAVIDLRYYQQDGAFPDEEAAQVMVNVINGIDSWEREQESQDRVSCSIYLDEAHLWVPQQAGDTTMKMTPDTYNALQAALFSTIVRMGGKMGFGLRLATQRIVEIDKRALQSFWTFIYRQSLQNDLDRIKQYGIPPDEVRTLSKGECFILGPEVRVKVHMAERRSPHGGDSPTIENLIQHQRRNQVHSVASVLSHASQQHETPRPVSPTRSEYPAIVSVQHQPMQKSITTTPLYEYIPFDHAQEEPLTQKEGVSHDGSDELQIAAKYWNEGANSVRKLAQTMNVSFDQARIIRIRMIEQRLISADNER